MIESKKKWNIYNVNRINDQTSRGLNIFTQKLMALRP